MNALPLYLQINGYTDIHAEKSYIAAVGDIPICLVAHLDTVFSKLPNTICYDDYNKIMWSPDGAGFDDKAGIYAIIKIIESGYKPHILFTCNEEIGGEGAADAAYTLKFDDLKAVIELDRQGREDCVFYDCDNKKFTKYIESFGFKTAKGSFTDICFVCPEWNVAGVNLSVGYYREHTYAEHLYCNELDDTIEKVKKILSKAKSMPYFKFIQKKHTKDNVFSSFNFF